MANFLMNALSPLSAALFRADDVLSFGPGLNGNDVNVTTNGLTTTLSAAGVSLDFPSMSLYQAGNAGHISLLDGTHLFPGTSSADSFTGTSGTDQVYGGDGNDQVTAGEGHDWVYGGAGSDRIYGGSGNDHLYGYGATSGTDGADSMWGEGGNDYLQGNAGDDFLDGGDGNDRINGGADNDRIYGDAGNDSINGNFGDDIISGGTGNDWLRGGKGSDLVYGEDGNDTLMGDLGADTLVGGAGADEFRFAAPDAPLLSTNTLLGNIDVIADFHHGEDHMALAFHPADVVYGALNGTVTQLLTYAQQLLDGSTGSSVAAVSVGNDTMLFFNGAGGHLADSVIELQGVTNTAVTLSDFI